MSFKNFIILLIIAPIFLYSCSDSVSSDDKIVFDTMINEDGLSEKDAKCILKETKPLVEKELWGEYIAAVKKGGKVNEHLPMDKLMTIGMTFSVGYTKCGVPLT
jgi:hypothetical protein